LPHVDPTKPRRIVDEAQEPMLTTNAGQSSNAGRSAFDLPTAAARLTQISRHRPHFAPKAAVLSRGRRTFSGVFAVTQNVTLRRILVRLCVGRSITVAY
jgi:hypothetical protein